MPIIKERGKIRRVHDVYQTEPAICYAVLKEVIDNLCSGRRLVKVLDAGCDGDGNWGFALRKLEADLGLHHFEIHGCDIRTMDKPEGYDYFRQLDFTAKPGWYDGEFDIVMMNAPFDQIVDFMKAGWIALNPHGIMISFARTGIISGQERNQTIWSDDSEMMYRYHIVLPERPSFITGYDPLTGEPTPPVTVGEDGKENVNPDVGDVDADEYCVLVFDKAWDRKTNEQKYPYEVRVWWRQYRDKIYWKKWRKVHPLGKPKKIKVPSVPVVAQLELAGVDNVNN